MIIAKAANKRRYQLAWSSEWRSIAKLLLNWLLIILLYFSFSQQHFLTAQNQNQPYFRNYTTDDGLPSPEVHDILEDSKGYIWIATDNGVSRFDGYQFKNFDADHGLNNNVVFYLEEDEEGKIWMQTMSGNMYYFDRDSIYPYRYNHIIQQYRSIFVFSNGFLISADGWSYFSLTGLGILKINQEGAFKLLNENTPSSLVILEHTESAKTLFSSISSKSYEKVLQEMERNPADIHITVFRDSNLFVYRTERLSKPSSRIGVFSDKHVHLMDFWGKLRIFQNGRLLTTYTIPATVASFEKIDSAFWIGFNGRQGVNLYRNTDDLLHQRSERFLLNNSITAVLKDQLGGFWFGTLENGVFYAPNPDLEVINHSEEFNIDEIQVLKRGRDHQLLLGSISGTIYQLDTLNNIDVFFRGDRAVTDLHFDQMREQLWVGGFPTYSIKNGQKQYATYADSLNINASIGTNGLHPTNDPGLIFGSSGFGIELIDLARGVVTTTSRSGAYQERVFTVLEDRNRRTWVGNVRGLFEYRNGQMLPPPIEHPSLKQRIEALAELPDGTLVIGTKGRGVAFWKEDTIQVVDKKNGLTANMTENLAVDPGGRVWVGTLNGLNIIYRKNDRSDWNVKRLTMAHGLPSNEINSLCKFRNYMYVATSKGVVPIPLSINIEAKVPTPLIESVLVNGQNADLDAPMRLNYSQRNIQIYFICFNYKLGANNTPYRYRLSAQEAWVFTYDRSVNYAALAPGAYTFEIQAQNENGIWSDSRCLSFSVSYPFWQKWWFILTALALLSAIIYYWYHRRIAGIKEAADIEKQITDLQRSALQAQMNPHFIFNCLNAIQNCIVSGDKSGAVSYLARFAALVRTTLHASLQPTISLEEEIGVLENYLELEKLRFGNKFTYTIEVDATLDQFEVTLPPLLVQPLAENAILHGFNFRGTPRLGQLYIAYQPAGDFLQIIVRDNGIGIEQSKLNRQGKEKLHNSVGMSITEKRLSLQNTNGENKHLVVRELVDSEGKACGTEIIIRIKL